MTGGVLRYSDYGVTFREVTTPCYTRAVSKDVVSVLSDLYSTTKSGL